MFRLYDYDVHTLIDKSQNEGDIINTISVFMEEPTNQRFIVKYTDEATHTDTIITTIKNVRDFYNYALDYNNRLKQESCVQLKKEIIKRNDKLC